MTCSHIQNAPLNLPTAYTQVHKEECTQCFDDQDGPNGIDVCLTCFNGGCVSEERHHALTHHQLSGHPLAVNIRRITVNQNKRSDDGIPPQKISKLAIDPSAEEPLYEFQKKLRCYACDGQEASIESTPEIKAAVDAVLSALSSAKQSEVKAWEEVITPCEHTLCLSQEAPKKLEQQDLAHCAGCDLKENLWLCLVCGKLGCGRRQYDGSGGNNHAIEHFQQTGHAVSVKMGTITPEGTADIYCYSCDDSRLDHDLATHLANWGINVSDQLKTEKSMTELTLEQNLKFDFSMTTEDGKQLEPKFGPSYTGLKNLGNSCYMASVLQSIFNIESFQNRYNTQLKDHAKTCTNEPANCWHCQLHKLADGILSGRYSQPKTNDDNVQYQDGIAPRMFKDLVGKGHEEFSTMRQQDAFEFFQYLCKTIRQKEHSSNNDPTKLFDFMVEQRLQCGKCKKVRYQKHETSSISVNVPARKLKEGDDEGPSTYEPVNFYECLDTFVSEEPVEGYDCPNCREKTTAYRSNKFSTFPEILVINPRRFAFINWVPQKLPVTITFPEGLIQLDKYVGTGQQPGEELLPEESKPNTGGVTFNQSDIDQLMAMGFSENRCKRALMNTGHNGAEVAMNWMFEHMEDPDIDDPLPTDDNQAGNNPSDEQTAMLQDMGFTAAQARKALRETGNDTERALDWLFSHPDDNGQDEPSTSAQEAGDSTPPFNYQLDSFVSHKGTSVHCGHYVSHVYKHNEWILFNDNKVAVTPNPPVGEAYLYFLRRQK
ncbi:ubiquitinyl hydrolase [Rhizopus microsporus]|nr:ubiquitinyl hydrolase [Rhizopus microsporus]